MAESTVRHEECWSGAQLLISRTLVLCPYVDKPLKSLMHGQYSARSTVTVSVTGPCKENYVWYQMLGDEARG